MHLRSIVVAALAAVSLCACTGHSRTIVTSQGPVTETQSGSGSNSTVTIQTNQGTGTYGANAVNPAELGLPIYPGASQSNTAGYAATSKEGSGKVVMMTTNDSFDKVYAWYSAHMPAGSQQMHMTAQSGSIAAFAIGTSTDKEQKGVTITSSANGHGGPTTSIMLTDSTKP